MNSLTQYTLLLNRFPKFELSYETISHKKVSASDSIAVAISLGRKYFIWYTYSQSGKKTTDICYLIGLDKDKQICSVDQIHAKIPDRGYLGTIVYGTLYEPVDSTTNIFIAEDIYYHSGVNLSNLCFGDRLGFLREFVETLSPTVSTFTRNTEKMQINKGDDSRNASKVVQSKLGVLNDTTTCNNHSSDKHSPVIHRSPTLVPHYGLLPKDNISIRYALPIMWYIKSGADLSPNIPANLASQIAYTTHHIQYRDIRRVAPYINVAVPKRGSTTPQISSATVAQKMTATAIMNPIPIFDFSKSAYRYPAVFNITADPQLDLYHLYAYGGPNTAVYCGLVGIQSLKTSTFMNRLFRRIRENDNLDLAEESEDETDFENMDTNKYVNLNAVIAVECAFNQKHKKWTPIRLAGKTERLIHIDKLVVQNQTVRRDDGPPMSTRIRRR